MTKPITSLCLITVLTVAYAGIEGTAKTAKRSVQQKTRTPAKAPATVENKWRKVRPLLEKQKRTVDFSENSVKEFLQGKRNSLNGYDAF